MTVTPGRDELLAGLIQDAISVLHHDTTDGSDVDKYERECLRKKFSARLAAKPTDETAPPKPAPDAMREALAYASTNQIAVCRCGSFPRLYDDGARPDDGYRSLWCQTCMEHVTEMKPSEREVIDYWNDLREREHAALSTPVPPASGPITTEQLDQLQFGRPLHERPVPPADGANGVEIRWQRVNGEPFEYAIQQGPYGDTFVNLLNGTCLRRPLSPSGAVAAEPVRKFGPVEWSRETSET